jgi:hypothetical protein
VVEFDWLCPHCGRRHWAKESVRSHKTLRGLWGVSPCRLGPMEVRLPGIDTTPRDEHPNHWYRYEEEVCR